MSTGLFRVNDLNKKIAVDITDNTGIDLSLVTGASIKYQKPDGTTGTWAGVMSNQTTTTLTVTFTTAGTAPSELDQSGEWGVYASLTHSLLGTIRSDSEVMWVDPEYKDY